MNSFKTLIAAAVLSTPLSAMADDTVIPINIRPFACQKTVSRSQTTDVPIAIYNDRSGFPVGYIIKDVTIEGWVVPTKKKTFKAKDIKGQNPQCTVKAGQGEDTVVVYYFPRWAILNLYDEAPYSANRVLAQVVVYGSVEDGRTFVAFDAFNIVK